MVHFVKMVELLMEPEVLCPLSKTVDEPKSARDAGTTTATIITATTSFPITLANLAGFTPTL